MVDQYTREQLYDYQTNANLVVNLATFAPRENASSGEPDSLAGIPLYKFGDRAITEKPAKELQKGQGRTSNCVASQGYSHEDKKSRLVSDANMNVKKLKQCEWCTKQMLPCNFKKHLDCCFYKTKLKMTYTQVERLRKYLKDESLVEREETQLEELKTFLQTCFLQSKTLHDRIFNKEDDPQDDIIKIKEMLTGEKTKHAYLLEWKKYKQWMRTQTRKVVDKATADSYLAQLKCKVSTLRKKQYMMQALMQHLVDPTIRLNKVRQRVDFKQKYAMTEEETQKYLEEQQEVNHEDYLIQLIMVVYGLRINTIASLKIKHLEFLDGEKNTINLPDSKVKRFRIEEVQENLQVLLKNFVEGRDDVDENYVFDADESDKPVDKRAHDIGVRINNRIRSSNVLKLNSNYQFSSHMFRKTKAFNKYQEGLEQLKEEVRCSIGQSHGSTAVESYISMDK